MVSSKRVSSHIQLSIASTFMCVGCILVALSLAVDNFQVRDRRQGNKRTVIWRGLLKDCHKEYSHIRLYSQKCYSWNETMATSEFLIIHRDLMVTFIGVSLLCGAFSIVMSMLDTSRDSKAQFYLCMGGEALSGVVALVASVTYAGKFIYPPWRPSVSLFLLAMGSIFMLGSFILHCCVGDVKFCGRICKTQSQNCSKYDEIAHI